MKFRFARRAEIIRFQSVSRTSEIFQSVAGFQTRESEVRRKRARLARESERFERLFHRRGEFGEIRSGLDAAPQHARLEFVGEESEDAEIHGNGLRGADGRERGADLWQFLRIRFTQKFQSNMHGFGADPARGAAFRFQALAERREGVAYRAGQVEGDEEAHGVGSGSGGCGKKIVAAHGVQRGLRGELANTFAVAGKTIGALARAVLVSAADVHQAHGLFRSAAAGPGNAGDADAESGAGAFTDAVGERESYFGAYGAFRFDQTLRNADERNFQLVAVANYAAQKIRGAAGDVGEAFGEHAAGAAFGDGYGGAIFSENARDNFLQGFSLGGIEMFAEGQGHAVGDFVEKFFGFRSVARPGARMQLRAGGGGENGGFGVGIKLIERADARFDVGFAEAGGAQVAGEEALVTRNFGETRADFGFENGFQLVRHAGEQHDDVAIGFQPQRRSSAARIRENGGSFGNHGLAFIDFRHGARETAETFLDFAHDGFVEMKFAAEKFGDGFARAVVVGGAQAAAGDDQVGAVERMAEGGTHFVGCIADHRFVDYADADLVELVSEPEGISVEAIGREQFGTDRNDLRIHLQMLYSMRSGVCKSGGSMGSGSVSDYATNQASEIESLDWAVPFTLTFVEFSSITKWLRPIRRSNGENPLELYSAFFHFI